MIVSMGNIPGDFRTCALLLGSAVFSHMGSLYRANSSDLNTERELDMRVGGLRVSSHVPVAVSDKQNGLISLNRSETHAVAPVWQGVTLIPDPVTKAATGQLIVTAVCLCAFKVLRSAAFYKQQAQLA